MLLGKCKFPWPGSLPNPTLLDEVFRYYIFKQIFHPFPSLLSWDSYNVNVSMIWCCSKGPSPYLHFLVIFFPFCLCTSFHYSLFPITDPLICCCFPLLYFSLYFFVFFNSNFFHIFISLLKSSLSLFPLLYILIAIPLSSLSGKLLNSSPFSYFSEGFCCSFIWSKFLCCLSILITFWNFFLWMKWEGFLSKGVALYRSIPWLECMCLLAFADWSLDGYGPGIPGFLGISLVVLVWAADTRARLQVGTGQQCPCMHYTDAALVGLLDLRRVLAVGVPGYPLLGLPQWDWGLWAGLFGHGQGGCLGGHVALMFLGAQGLLSHVPAPCFLLYYQCGGCINSGLVSTSVSTESSSTSPTVCWCSSLVNQCHSLIV